MAEKKKSTSKAKKSASSGKKTPPAKAAAAPRPESPNQHYAIVLFAAAILVALLALIQGNSGWLAIHKILKGLFGLPLLVIPPALCYTAVMLEQDVTPQKIAHRTTYIIAATVFASAFLEIMFHNGRLQDLTFSEAIRLLYEEGQSWSSGGLLSVVAYPIQLLFGDIGSKIIICLLLFVSIMFASRKSLSDLFDMVKWPVRKIQQFWQDAQEEREILDQYEDYDEEDDYEDDYAGEDFPEEEEPLLPEHEEMLDIDIPFDEPEETESFSIDVPMETEFQQEDPEIEELIQKAAAKPKKKKQKKTEASQDAVLEIADEISRQDVQIFENGYQLPTMDFLNAGRKNAPDKAEEEKKKEKLRNVLADFNVEAEIKNATRGPSVTRYEVQPKAGVKVSRVTNLANDIALNFATDGIRIEAPIPGKPYIGIEVPNNERDTVSLRELLESEEFKKSRSKLTFGVGKDIAGNVIIGDIAKMPHMIIAGATGSGKSVCTNSIIMSILYHASPEEVKMILIDPKIVEFRVYDGIPHLLIPVVTDPKKAAGALGWAVQEMMKRYDVFAENSVRNLEEFNQKCEENPELQKMPQILICIDELAELMMTASKEVEDAICRLAQLARAAGMHLIIATQRPTTNIITGLIKANVPSRIALSVKSQIDSRVILDMGGAETLLGNGDMLYLPNGQPKPVRVQGCYVSTSEIEKVVSFIKEQSVSEYDENIIQAVDKLTVNAGDEKAASGGGSGHISEPEIDEDASLIDQAIDVVVAAGQASTSNLQRRLRLGYGRAARIMDELEKMGIIGPYEGAKPRRVLITKEQLDERKLRKMK